MRRRLFVVSAMLMAALNLCAASSSYVVPTTTLAAQTSNNTSAANSFKNQSNNNKGAGNISKVDIHSLLYPGATTKIYAHMLLWFGESNHMNIGYSSTDPAQVQRQISDMVSRGIDGVVIDWYGPNNAMDKATQLVMAESEKHPGFTFALMIDQGALEWDSCSGCSPQQALTSQLQYIEKTYFTSPAYMTIDGQPVITNFNVDLSFSVDWNAANATLGTHPVFIFQNNSGFNHTLSNGSYSWVMPTTKDYGANYLNSFYHDGMSFPSEQTVGATYKGFNDTLASWGSNRIMGQQCGQTWLQTFSQINNLYNSGKQLSNLQLVTWNDYEEATEIESGIDNCFSVSASVSANGLQWTTQGDETTVDHYTVYISSDGQNLMSLADLESGIHSLNLCAFSIPSGNYDLFVQAVGKPTLANQITGTVSYNPSCPATVTQPPPPPTLSFSASPGSVTIASGQSGKFTVIAQTQSGSFNSPIALSCSGISSALSCSFSPSTITPGSGTATATLTVSSVPLAKKIPPPRGGKSTLASAAWLLPFNGIAGFFFIGNGQRRRWGRTLALLALVSVSIAGVSCGGKSTLPVSTGQSTVVPASNYSVTVHGNSNAGQLSTTISVTVQ